MGTIRRRATQLLVPFLCMSLLSFLLRGDYTFTELSKIIICPDKYFWFLWVLFWISVVFVLNKWIALKVKMDEFIPIGVTCLTLLLLMVGLEVRMFGFQFLSYYFLFYTLGYCIHRFNFLQVKGTVPLLMLFGLWIIMAWSWNMHKLPDWMPQISYIPSGLLQYVYRGLTAAIAIIFILSVSPRVLNVRNKFNLFISRIGVVSLGVYVWHCMVMGYIVKLLMGIMPSVSTTILIIITFVASFACTMLIVEILKSNKLAARLFLGKI